MFVFTILAVLHVLFNHSALSQMVSLEQLHRESWITEQGISTSQRNQNSEADSSSANSIGIPCSDKSWYARNIWSMIAFQNTLYVGCGDSLNNAGPINIWSYTDSTGWVNEFTVDEQQIDRITVIDGVLTIPGTDSTQNWDFGNFYRLLDGKWQKFRTIPHGVHIYDMKKWNNLLFAGITTDIADSAAFSSDNGQTWQLLAVPAGATYGLDASQCPPSIYISVVRFYQFFTIGSELYGNTSPAYHFTCQNQQAQMENIGVIAHWTNGQFVLDSSLDLFAGLKADRVAYPLVYGDKTVYLVAQTVDATQWKPIAVMSIDTTLHSQSITLPNCNRPQALELQGKALYVLCNQQTDQGWYVSVQVTCNLQSWNQVLSFDAPTFARSFAQLGNVWYFGLGGDLTTPVVFQTSVGEVLQKSPDGSPTSNCAE